MSDLFGQKRLIYFPELRWKVGSVQSAILMTRLEQYFEGYGCNSELQNYLYPQPKLIKVEVVLLLVIAQLDIHKEQMLLLSVLILV